MKRNYENRRIMSIRYIVIVCLFLIIGVLAANALYRGSALMLYVVSFALFIATAFAAILNKRVLLILFTALVLAFGTGLLAFNLEIDGIAARRIGSVDAEIKGKIALIYVAGSERFNGYLSEVEIIADGRLIRLEGKTEFRDFGGADYTYVEIGDSVVFRGKIEDAFMIKDSVNSRYYRDGVYYRIAGVESVIAIDYNKSLSFNEKARNYVKDAYLKHLPDNAAALARALVLGETVDVENMSAYEDTGLLHIFSVSGLHISFVILILGMLLPKKRRLLRFAVIMTGATFYAWICGFPPSALRALIMSGCVLLAHNGGSDGVTNLALSMLAILIFKPLYIFDAGFLMSYGAMLGIVTLGTKLNGIVRRNYILKGDRKLSPLSPLIYSLSASAGVFPVVVQYSGFFSIVGIIITPLVITLITVTFILLIIGLIPYLSFLFLICGGTLTAIDKAIVFISQSGLSGVSLVPFGAAVSALYLAIIVGAGFVNLNKRAKYCALAGLFVVFAALTAITYLPSDSHNLIIVSDAYSDYCTVLLDESGNMGVICNMTGMNDVYEILDVYDAYRIYSFQLFITNARYTSAYALTELTRAVDVNEIVIFNNNLAAGTDEGFARDRVLTEIPDYNPFGIKIVALTGSSVASLSAVVAGKRVLIFDRYYSSSVYFDPKANAASYEEYDIIICPKNAERCLPLGKPIFCSCFPADGFYSTADRGSISIRLDDGVITVV